MKQNQSRKIVFVAVPDSLRGQVEAWTGSSHDDPEEAEARRNFTIDPAIPLPVELPQGASAIDWETLSGEMILSGMIRVIMEDPDAENAAYYRGFVQAVKPNLLEEFSEAAILKARNGDFDTALEIITALRGVFPRSPSVLLNRALILENKAAAREDILERAGRLKAVQTAAQTAAQADAAQAETVQTDAAQAEAALVCDAYAEVLALNPPFPNGIFNAGFFYMKRRNFSLAKACFTAYLPLADDPDKQERAQALLREIEHSGLDDPALQEAYDRILQGDEQGGILRIRDFLERRPGVWNGWFILGWGLRRLCRWEDGAASFKKVLELGGDTGDTRNELAICLMELGDYSGARKELETALRMEPENTKIISNRGALALKQGKPQEAAGFFRAVLGLDPDDPVAAAYLRKLGLEPAE
jgi:tetratricopeptide (TPR) repeat protein